MYITHLKISHSFDPYLSNDLTLTLSPTHSCDQTHCFHQMKWTNLQQTSLISDHLFTFFSYCFWTHWNLACSDSSTFFLFIHSYLWVVASTGSYRQVAWPYLQADLILLHLTILWFSDAMFLSLFFYRVEDIWQLRVQKIYRCHFPNPICSCHVSVSHFGNSCSTCKFFIFIVCALLFCGSVIFSVTMATDFLFRIFKFCTLIFFFRHHAVSQLIDYSRV